MFTSEQDDILKELLLHIPSIKLPKQTPFKKHTLPDLMKHQLYQILLQEQPEWTVSRTETEKRIARLNREQYVPRIEKQETKKPNSFMKRLFAAKKETEEEDFFASPDRGMGVMEVDTPTKPKSVTKKRKVEMKSSPAKKILESPKKSPKHVTIHEDVLKTPVRSSKRLGKKVVPIFDTPKNDSDESPTRKVHFAVVPGSDPFYSPKTESRVPDIQSPKPLFAQVCMINETVTRSRIRKVRPELVETIITESPTKRRSPRFLRI